MTRSKMIIPVVIALAGAAAFWFLILSPKREEIAKLDTEIQQKDSEAQQAEQQATLYAKAKDNFRSNYTTVVRLGKAVPADDDVRSLMYQIDDAASRAKVDFRSMSVTGSTAPGETAVTSDGTLAPAPGSVPVGSAGFSAMPFNFAFSGSFFKLSDFFDHLDRFVSVKNDDVDVTGRLMLIGSIAVTPDQGDLGKLQAQIGAATYIVPPTQGVTAGASPQAPAGASPEAGTDPGLTTPTATITGVR